MYVCVCVFVNRFTSSQRQKVKVQMDPSNLTAGKDTRPITLVPNLRRFNLNPEVNIALIVHYYSDSDTNDSNAARSRVKRINTQSKLMIV